MDVLSKIEKELIMSFAEWKKRSEAFKNVMDYSVPTDDNIHRACQAAYKAGERQGRKDAEKIAKRAIELRALLDAKK